MAAGLLDIDGAPGELFWLAPDSELKQVVDTALDLVRRTPAILTRIDEDQDVLGLAKKQRRQIDARWQASFTDCFPGLTLPEPPDLEARGLLLEQGRPRMPAEVVYLFFTLQGYLGSITDRRARDQLLESHTLNVYLQSRGLRLPGWTTILENVNALSVETRNVILDARLAMIREGKIAAAILGAMEVAENGDLANWMIPGKLIKGMGGAMDLVAGVGRVIVVMDHANKHGESKLLKECTLPLTGKGVVDRIITNLGVLDVVEGGLKIVEVAEGVTEDELRAATAATIVN